MTEIATWQAHSGAWVARNFPDDGLTQRGLILAEETGEVARCIAKAHQDIRGGREYWLSELRTESVDVFFALCAIANSAGFDLGTEIEKLWPAIEAKTFVRGPA
jgi:NTP pyrophosphatase (non-canonical NTP hydrolase)